MTALQQSRQDCYLRSAGCHYICYLIIQQATPQTRKEIGELVAREWFQEMPHRDTPRLDAFCAAFAQGDDGKLEDGCRDALMQIEGITEKSEYDI